MNCFRLSLSGPVVFDVWIIYRGDRKWLMKSY